MSVGMHSYHLSRFHQDTDDWTNPETGEVFPASFNWYANLTAVRASDGQQFYVKVQIPASDFGDMDAAQAILEHAFMCLEHHADSSEEVTPA